MRSLYSAAVATLCLAIGASSFAPSLFGSRSAVSSSTTELYISSWGTRGNRPFREIERPAENPEDNIQAYLQQPKPVESRGSLDGSVLVSGLVKSQERTDQTVFDLLNDEDSAFAFDKIIAFVDDEKFAKKRLLSRSARYTGLLDKLDFVQASTPGALPTLEQLSGVKSWVAHVDADHLATLQQIAVLAKQAESVENLSVLLVNAHEGALADDAATKAALASLQDDGSLDYSVVAVGKIEEHAEGKVPYQFRTLGEEDGGLPADAIFSRDESLRMVTECLQLESGIGKTFACTEVYDVNQTEAKLIKGLREGGYTRPQEIDHMIKDGPEVRFGMLSREISGTSAIHSQDGFLVV